MTFISGAIATLLAVASNPAVNNELFEVLDRNHDGVIVSGEVAEPQRVWFARALRVADNNGDARLTSQELNQALTDPQPRKTPAGRQRSQRQRLNPERLDRNRDGLITLNEVPAPGKKRFKKLLKRTGKNAISVKDFFQMTERGGKSKTMRKDPKDSRIRDSEMKGTRKQKDRLTKKQRKDGRRSVPLERFRRFDKNQDGRISRNEAPDRLKTRFDRIDADGDGELTEKELTIRFDRRRQKSKSK
ncbi:MAG: hypothetical protein MK110_01905 [Fuerstiella sp.]|nr:hypothetical protein [Fuerstiella sp.]